MRNYANEAGVGCRASRVTSAKIDRPRASTHGQAGHGEPPLRRFDSNLPSHAEYNRAMRVIALIALIAGCGTDEPSPAWMAAQPDERSLAALTIPGSHDAAARFEPLAGLARTQDLTIDEQVTAGVRFLDIRCRHLDDAFLLYHGAIDQNLTFDQLLVTLYAFLDAHPTETILVSIKEEAAPSGNTRTFD